VIASLGPLAQIRRGLAGRDDFSVLGERKCLCVQRRISGKSM
jgi:hypothetical protein